MRCSLDEIASAQIQALANGRMTGAWSGPSLRVETAQTAAKVKGT
jgi:hypothetical protein